MNDPLYNHPAWKVSGSSDSVDIDHVIGEIVKSNYITKSHDMSVPKVNESVETKVKNSPPSPETSVAETLSEKLECTSRTPTSANETETAAGHVCQKLETSEKESDTQTCSEEMKYDLKREGKEYEGDDSIVDRHTQKDGFKSQNIDSVTIMCDSNESTTDPDCTECRTVHPDPTPPELMMFLHALSYKVRYIRINNIIIIKVNG